MIDVLPRLLAHGADPNINESVEEYPWVVSSQLITHMGIFELIEHEKAIRVEKNGMLEAKFHDCVAGWIRFTIAAENRGLSIHASAIFDSFPEFMEWLEALASGADSAAFSWIGEGQYWDFQFTEGNLAIADSKEDNPFQYRGNSMDIVSALYGAFLQFIQSEEYKPEEWERYTYGEEWEKAVQGKISRHEILEHLLTLNGEDIVQTEFRLNPVYRVQFRDESGGEDIARFVEHVLNPDDKSLTFGAFEEPDCLDLPDNFDEWDLDKRREWLTGYMNEYDPFSGFGGAKLMEMRSFKIERMLQLGNDQKG